MDRRDFLEISPFQADEGELIGKDPSDMPSEILSLKFRAQNPLKAIRAKCLDCCCGNAARFASVWRLIVPRGPFAWANNPFRKKPELSSAENAGQGSKGWSRVRGASGRSKWASFPSGSRIMPNGASRPFPLMPTRSQPSDGGTRSRLSGSSRLAERFHEAEAFGFQLGPTSHITALDIDSQDEAILADALTYHGDTPFIVRTGGGYHAYYGYAGERRLIRPYHDKPVDILGGGFVVAPPSVAQKGTYQIISGSLDDLANLPPIHVVLDGLRSDVRVEEGRRNNTIFRFALEQTRHCRLLRRLARRYEDEEHGLRTATVRRRDYLHCQVGLALRTRR